MKTLISIAALIGLSSAAFAAESGYKTTTWTYVTGVQTYVDNSLGRKDWVNLMGVENSTHSADTQRYGFLSPELRDGCMRAFFAAWGANQAGMKVPVIIESMPQTNEPAFNLIRSCTIGKNLTQ